MDEESLVKKKNKAQRDGNVQILADVLKKLGDLYFDKKRYDEALEAYKEQLQACECLSDKLNCAIAHRMIGEVYADLGNFNEALNHQNLYLEIAKQLGDLTEEQRAFATLGRTHLLLADSLLKDSEKDKKMEVLRNAKKAFSRSIKLCDRLENKIDVSELMMMRARLLLNLGLVLEQQKNTELALNLIEQAASLCKKYNLHEDMHRTNIALAGINERLGNSELAIKYLDAAAKIDDFNMKIEAKLSKAELLLRLGEWMEAQKILYSLYKNKRILEPLKQQVTKLLRIAVVLCRTEDELLTKDNLSEKEKLYEKMGDAAIAVKSLEKAAEYYRNMLDCAERTNSNQLGAALTSLTQTLYDACKYQEAIPYSRRELELCSEPKDACNSALFLANLLIDAKSTDKEIREIFDQALLLAKEANDSSLERVAIKRYVSYLEKMDDVDLKEIVALNEKLESLPIQESQELEFEEDEETPDIGADICLDELSDAESEKSVDKARFMTKNNTKRARFVIKKNEKGETQLHVACIKGNVAAVEKLLEDHHPTAVRDHCGWTPLHEASNYGFTEIVKLLIRFNADVNDPGGKDCDGVTPLHDAAANGHCNIIQLLLDNGADPNLLTKSGESALDCLEHWRDRTNNLTTEELKDYVCAKRRLSNMISGETKKKKKFKRDDQDRGWNALIDEEEESRHEKMMVDYLKPSKPEKISAGEDYKRTIESMQHPGRSNMPTNQINLPKITAPLIDSEEMLVNNDDWLEDDLGLFTGKKKDKIQNGIMPMVNSNAPPVKRKSKNESDHEIERDVDKNMKRQKISLTLREKEPPPIQINEDSCDSNSCDKIFELINDNDNWPKKKKKPRQTNLLKQGFTKHLNSRSPSPVNSFSPEPITTSPITRIELDKYPRDFGNINDTLNLEIQVDKESFDLKLHFRDLKKTMNDIEDLISHKFEMKTGFKPRLKFRTLEGVSLAPEIVLEEVPRDSNKLKLSAEIVQGDLPPIADRYKKVCENFNIDASEPILKSLRSCDNTSTFRLNSHETTDEEIEPLLTCLHYQKNLQILNLSSATFFHSGDLLNRVISRLENLCELHLQCCDIDYECLSLIEKFPSQIRVLDLSYNPLSGKSQKKLYELLEPLKYLQTLSLRSCYLDDFKFSISSNSLISLDLSWNPIGGEGAANFLQRQLLNLNLSNTQNFKNARKNVIDEIFFKDSLVFNFFTLETLELSSCGATDLDVEKILSQAPNLTRLNLSNNINVTKTSLCALLNRKRTMTLIDLSGCNLIEGSPDSNVRIVTPQICTLFVHMKFEVIDSWESLWQGKGISKKLPHSLVIFKPL